MIIMKFLTKLISPVAWKERIERWRRTINVSRKPDLAEFKNKAKITSLGLVMIGAIGFLIFIIYRFTIGVLM